MKLRCLIVGGQSLAVQCADLLLERGHEIVGIVTPDANFRDWAAQRSIDTLAPSADIESFGASKQFDCLFSIVNGRILPDGLVRQAARCAVNFHDGPLPGYAGFNVTTWALIDGQPTHGVTWHGMEGGIDSGDIFKQVIFDIAPNETAFTLNAKCWDAALDSFGPLVDGIASGSLIPEPQDLSKRTYIGRYRRPAGLCLLDFSSKAEDLERLARGIDFGSYANPIGALKFWDGQEFVLVTSLTVETASSGQAPGFIVSAPASDSIVVATATADVLLRGLKRINGAPWTSDATRLPSLDADSIARLTTLHESSCRHEAFWVKRLGQASPLPLERDFPAPASAKPAFRIDAIAVDGLETAPAGLIPAAFLAQLAQSAGITSGDIGFQDAAVIRNFTGSVPGAPFSATVPLRVECDLDSAISAFRARLEETLTSAAAKETFLRDLPLRYPQLRTRQETAFPVGVRIGDPNLDLPLPGAILNLIVSPDGKRAFIATNTAAVSEFEAAVRRERLQTAVSAALAQPDAPVSQLPAISETERQRLLDEWNRTQTGFEDLRVHEFFERQAAARPAAIALAHLDQSISYGDLDSAATNLAAHLQSLGAGPGARVGVMVNRSIDMMVALLATLKTGAAYLPLDPTLPRQRRQFMIEDAGVSLVVTETSLEAELEARPGLQAVLVDAWDGEAAAFTAPQIDPNAPAYVIYTSGSTGKPKGVVVTHHNVANFFAGMDGVIGLDSDPGVWLAVTSISFDISVLELFWTLARGFKVVIAADEHRAMIERTEPETSQPVDFSLFYFATDQGGGDSGGNKYRLLLEGAKFADTHGFHAVWTPERHFHSFGGLYPNPSVTAAAVAASTTRVRIHAGSVVAPLHSPIRVAEEWSVVDNISNGRVGISFAAGWHSRDFVLAPGNYAGAKNIMYRTVDQVRRLWRGETLEFIDGVGNQTPISILPRPIQKELPVWITAAVNPETFRQAGEGGYNILTHLLGQKLEDVEKKIRIYREARKSKGLDPNGGRVTLMLHTFVGETNEQARECTREPMKNYLKTSVDLIKNAPWSFPAFSNRPGLEDMKSADLNSLTPEELDALLEFAFERYFETSGLFGTVDECVEFARKVAALGVDEIGCLIDFGVETDLALKNLELLNQVRERCQSSTASSDFSLPAQISRHRVTHLQCTPSMARMLTSTDDSRAALKSLRKLMVGGEALPGSLAADLAGLVTAGDVHNMYGPTETTIWSTTAPVTSGSVNIGRPIANTTIYILDAAMRPVPTGYTGDLYIGGTGVAQGYWNRPDLDAERFLNDPFRPGERIYRTGDLARYAPDGAIEFLGRSDFQVKIRGFRIELGEIETLMNRFPGIRESVVNASAQDGEDPVLTGYFVPSAPVDEAALKDWLRQSLPDYMTPAAFVEMERFPLTHNGKIDRKALPPASAAAKQKALADDSAGAAAEQPVSADNLEGLIAQIWRQALNRTAISVDDNFFDMGGHSILAIQVSTKLGKALDRKIPIIDMFRYPTIRTLATRLGGGAAAPETVVEDGGARAKLRLDLLASRSQQRRTARRPAQ